MTRYRITYFLSVRRSSSYHTVCQWTNERSCSPSRNHVRAVVQTWISRPFNLIQVQRMSTFLARLKRRSSDSPSPILQSLQSNAAPATHTPKRRFMPGGWFDISPLEHKIHPDLDSLVEDTKPSIEIRSSKVARTAQDRIDQGFVPLLPSTRKRSKRGHYQATQGFDSHESPDITTKVLTDVDLPDDIINRETSDRQETQKQIPIHPRLATSNSTSWSAQTPLTDIPSSPDKQTTPGEIWSTFGRPIRQTTPQPPGGYIFSDTRSTTPITLKTSSSLLGSAEARTQTPNYTSESRLGSSRNIQNTTSSPHTFGIPTPPSSSRLAFSSHRHAHVFGESPPPLPPLTHPAFLFSSISKTFDNTAVVTNLLHEDDFKHPRHASSLPSMSRGTEPFNSSHKNLRRSRRRARTQSRSKTFASTQAPLQSTPQSQSFRHLRSKSKESCGSSRRKSAEFSAAQASLVGHESNSTESWEVQVSREMVRLALGAGCQKNAGITEFGQTRGHNVSAFFHLSQSFFISYSQLLSPIPFVVHFLIYSSRYDNSRLKHPH